MTKKNRRGFSLIEAAIVLGVVGLVIGGIWIAASAVRRDYMIKETAEGLMYSALRLKSILSRQAVSILPVNANINSFLVSTNAVQKNWVDANGNVNTPISKSFVVSTNMSFNIIVFRLYGVSKKNCVNLIYRMSKISARLSGKSSVVYSFDDLNNYDIARIEVNTYTGYDWATHQHPISISTASNACKLNENYIVFSVALTR